MTDVTDFIGAAVEDKPVKAMKAFSAAMQPRIDAALDTKYAEVASSVFNPQVEADNEAEMNELEMSAEDEVVEVEEPEQEFETEMEEPQDV
jgi:hypothetical protein